jgi:hypothetical protein
MPQFNSPIDILKILPKTNCRECGSPTCLAFAAAVTKSQKQLADCPHLDSNIVEQAEVNVEPQINILKALNLALSELKDKVRAIDIPGSADRVGGTCNDDKLTITCLGKGFTVDPKADIVSQCHTNPWFTVTFLGYVLRCQGKEPTGEWMPLRALKGGMDWAPLFGKRCEEPIKKLADTYPDLFEDIMTIFNGRMTDQAFGSDISMLLYPFPKVPMLICYWKPEDGMESSLNLFFDSTASDNMSPEYLYYLGAGMARMFENIARSHMG